MTDISMGVFAEEYLPEVVIDREEEQHFIANYLRDLLKGNRKVLYVHGAPGVGKTTVAKHIANQFEDAHNNATCIYLSSPSLTPNLALKKVYEAVCGEDRRRLPSSMMVHQIVDKLLTKQHVLAVVLDNFDKMRNVEDLLWQLEDLFESLPQMGLVLISTSEHELRDLIGNRLYSRLPLERYEFRPYSARRLHDILISRLQALGRRVAQDEAIWKLSHFVAKHGGSARYLIRIFLDSIDAAQSSGKTVITLDVAQSTLSREEARVKREQIEELREHAPRMFEVLRCIAELTQSGEFVDTGKLLEAIGRKGLAVSGRAVDYYLNNMESRGLIKLTKMRKNRGITRRIVLNVDATILKCVVPQ